MQLFVWALPAPTPPIFYSLCTSGLIHKCLSLLGLSLMYVLIQAKDVKTVISECECKLMSDRKEETALVLAPEWNLEMC